MPNTQNEKDLQDYVREAQHCLKDSNFNEFVKKMLLLGQAIQSQSKLIKYKGHKEELTEFLEQRCKPLGDELTPDQKLAFEVFQNAWQDEALPRLKNIYFTRNPLYPVQPNSCLWLKDGQKWVVIRVDSEGQEQAIDLSKLDDIAALAEKLPESLLDKASEDYSSEEKVLVARLKQKLKRENLPGLDQTSLAAKSGLSKAVRHQIKLGIKTFQWLCHEDVIVPARNEAGSIQAQEDDVAKRVRALDEKARKAIDHYQTPSQKITRVIGNILAAVAAFTYGCVELVAAIFGLFLAAGIVWTNPLLAIAGVLLLAGMVILPFPSTWTNWKVFSTYLPDFFNKIHEEYKEITSLRKKALFWVLGLCASATGIASGALAYTAIIALPAMMGLMAVSALFPPLAIFLGTAIAITQACSLIRNFCKILQKEDSWKAFKAPFLKVNQILDDNDAGRAKRFFTWFMVSALAVLATLGLCLSCFTSIRSVGKLFIDQFKTAPQKALALGVAIGGINSFCSRIYFTLNSAFGSALIVCKHLLKGDSQKEQKSNIRDESDIEDKSEISAQESRFPLRKIVPVVTDGVQAGAFYAQNIQSLTQQTPQDLKHDIDLGLGGMASGSAAILTGAAFFISCSRYLVIDLKHIDDPEDPYAKARQHAAAKRDEKNSAYLENNLFPLLKKENSPKELSYGSRVSPVVSAG